MFYRNAEHCEGQEKEREVLRFSLFSCLFYIGTFDYKTFFKYNYCRNLKEVIIMGKSSLR